MIDLSAYSERVVAGFSRQQQVVSLSDTFSGPLSVGTSDSSSLGHSSFLIFSFRVFPKLSFSAVLGAFSGQINFQNTRDHLCVAFFIRVPRPSGSLGGASFDLSISLFFAWLHRGKENLDTI